MIKISVCIPAYNRSQYLQPLLESIFNQDYKNYEIVICEDYSPERNEIISIVNSFRREQRNRIFFHLNEVNLGYDANIRELAKKATGDYCFYLGNDDLLVDGALKAVAEIVEKHPDVKYILRSYGWFTGDPSTPTEVIRYFSGDRIFSGYRAAQVGIRRAGVISGFVVEKESAITCATDKYDGTLYYQLHLAANAVKTGKLYYSDQMLTLSRSGIAPEFGVSKEESKFYTPGSYTDLARFKMLEGAMQIVKDNFSNETVDLIMADYARCFYPYIKDQLHLPPFVFLKFYRQIGDIGFKKYPLFHINCILCYVLGENLSDFVLHYIRRFRNFKTSIIQ